MPRRTAVVLTALLAGLAAPAAAQAPAAPPPGPYVADVRVATGRGLGVDLGAHVYIASLGSSRIGVGGTWLRLPGTTAEDVVTGETAQGDPSVTAIAPQLSFNFGTAAGWSTLSAGYGRARLGTGEWAGSINAGGGARWFLTDHAALGFDVRYHRLDADSVFAFSVGLSLK
jgi:hypothetical protein